MNLSAFYNFDSWVFSYAVAPASSTEIELSPSGRYSLWGSRVKNDDYITFFVAQRPGDCDPESTDVISCQHEFEDQQVILRKATFLVPFGGLA
jgi:hypothetical protein